ncbi:MAG: multiheme c-type cytochrome, partial [Planctomycetota bacterium]|nr:multiheme c-type cytochrome [Planctomycetota bacterium]
MTKILEYKPVMSAAQRWAFWIIIPLLAVLGANSLYLLAIPEENQNQFYLLMFLLHLVLGLLLMVPFVAFIVLHVRAAWGRENRRAIRAGLVLLTATLLLLFSGLIMMFRLKPTQASSPLNQLIYWAHILTPLLAGGMYVIHRRAGPRVHWNWGFAWAIGVAAFVGAMSLMHGHDPRKWHQVGSPEGEKYFEPSRTRTVTGNFIPERALMMEDYCVKCHSDAYEGWFHSAHHFSSFNNPAYRFSIRETRKVTMRHDPDGIARGARWCAGCHDQVPFLSGKFDDPNFDDFNDATAHAGITCTVCHAITNINSTRGNGDYTIDEPIHYPFAYSDNSVLQWINNQLVKAKPTFHKRTFLKPFHRTAEFCSVCHKVSLPFELNQYKEFLRGQNHYDPFLLSGVSGHGARSFYYPPKARESCAECHMPLAESDDFGSRDFAGNGKTSIHTHLFQSANTGMAAIRGDDRTVRAHRDFLVGADPDIIGPTMRIDIFGLKPGAAIDSPLLAPIRPELPLVRPGTSYLLEIVLRTLNVGHLFTQGTADSNEVWVELIAKSGDRVIGHNGEIAKDGQVDPWSHFINVHMLDRHGNRVDRRNAQDIFTPLYNNQMPPGTGQVVHYRLDVPADITDPIEIHAALHYRKFDRTYMDYVFPVKGGPELPVVTMCEDTVTLPVAGAASSAPSQTSPIKPVWQRWNDYGIGLLLEGNTGAEKGELRQAEEAFRAVVGIKPQHGLVNLARVFIKEGRLEEATEVLQQA